MKKLKENLIIIIVIALIVSIATFLIIQRMNISDKSKKLEQTKISKEGKDKTNLDDNYEQYSLPADKTKGVVQNFVGMNCSSFGETLASMGGWGAKKGIGVHVNRESNDWLEVKFISDDGGVVWAVQDNPNYDSNVDSGPNSETQIVTDNRAEYKVVSQTPEAGTTFTIGGVDEPSELVLHVKKVKR